MKNQNLLARQANVGFSAIMGSYVSAGSVLFGFTAVFLQSRNLSNTQIGLTIAIGWP